MHDSLVPIAIITSVHGIKGAVKVKAYTEDPYSLKQYSPLYTKDCNNSYDINILSVNKDNLIISIKDITDRNMAEKLKGVELYTKRSNLPKIEENEFYYADLVGLVVKSAKDDNIIGKILAIHNFGAGDILEIGLEKQKDSQLLPFNDNTVPEINITKGYISIIFPDIEFIDENK